MGVRERGIEDGGCLGPEPNEWRYHILNGGKMVNNRVGGGELSF